VFDFFHGAHHAQLVIGQVRAERKVGRQARRKPGVQFALQRLGQVVAVALAKLGNRRRVTQRRIQGKRLSHQQAGHCGIHAVPFM
jgi:hypothetical protein